MCWLLLSKCHHSDRWGASPENPPLPSATWRQAQGSAAVLSASTAIIQASVLYTEVGKYTREQSQPYLSLIYEFDEVFKVHRGFSDPKL